MFRFKPFSNFEITLVVSLLAFKLLLRGFLESELPLLLDMKPFKFLPLLIGLLGPFDRNRAEEDVQLSFSLPSLQCLLMSLPFLLNLNRFMDTLYATLPTYLILRLKSFLLDLAHGGNLFTKPLSLLYLLLHFELLLIEQVHSTL